MSFLSGTPIYAVEPGTIIRDGDRQLTVQDGTAVTKAGSIYLSKRDYQAFSESLVANGDAPTPSQHTPENHHDR